MTERLGRHGEMNDEEIERLREARRQISARFDHDPYRLVAHYQERQRKHPERILPAPESQPA